MNPSFILDYETRLHCFRTRSVKTSNSHVIIIPLAYTSLQTSHHTSHAPQHNRPEWRWSVRIPTIPAPPSNSKVFRCALNLNLNSLGDPHGVLLSPGPPLQYDIHCTPPVPSVPLLILLRGFVLSCTLDKWSVSASVTVRSRAYLEMNANLNVNFMTD